MRFSASSFWLRPRYPGLEAWVGFYVRDRNMGERSPTLDDLTIPNGWVVMPADEGGGTTPGTIDGGWPYIKHYPVLPVAIRERVMSENARALYNLQ